MAKTYKRKRITSLEDLDREESRLRKKAKQIEHEWTEMLDPQQLAINFLMNFIGKKISNRASASKPKKDFAYGKYKETAVLNNAAETIKEKKPFIKKAVKTIGITLAVLFVVKKFQQIKADRKRKQALAAT